jgi:hypothetical protein
LTKCNPIAMKQELSLGDVLKSWLKDDKVKHKLMQAKVVNGWASICGSFIAEHTTRVYLHNSELVVTVNSAPLRHELLLGQDLIIRNVNDFLGEPYIKSIKIY